MKSRGRDHQAMTNRQRELFNELTRSGRPNTLAEYSRITEEALIAGGTTPEGAHALVQQSFDNLARQRLRNHQRFRGTKNNEGAKLCLMH